VLTPKKFNVPIGSYKNPLVCDEKNLLALSQLFQNINIIYGDYREANCFIDSKTFVYFGNQYRHLNTTHALYHI
jgi:DNA adenine methylase